MVNILYKIEYSYTKFGKFSEFYVGTNSDGIIEDYHYWCYIQNLINELFYFSGCINVCEK